MRRLILPLQISTSAIGCVGILSGPQSATGRKENPDRLLKVPKQTRLVTASLSGIMRKAMCLRGSAAVMHTVVQS